MEDMVVMGWLFTVTCAIWLEKPTPALADDRLSKRFAIVPDDPTPLDCWAA